MATHMACASIHSVVASARAQLNLMLAKTVMHLYVFVCVRTTCNVAFVVGYVSSHYVIVRHDSVICALVIVTPVRKALDRANTKKVSSHCCARMALAG